MNGTQHGQYSPPIQTEADPMSSRIQDMMWFDPKRGPALTTTLFRIEEAGR